MKQKKSYGGFQAAEGRESFFALFFQKMRLDESPGTPLFSACSDGSDTFTFTGKEKDYETGYYNFGARYYDPVLSGLFLSVDPMADKYPYISPYAYCAWNPIKLVDPDGKVVKSADKQSKSNIIHSLSKSEAKYVRFDKNGNIKLKRLNRCNSNSINFNALKTLANSRTEYIFSTETYHIDLYNDVDLSNPYKKEGVNTRGVTLMPGNDQNPSPDNNVYVITSSDLSDEDQVLNLAHEGYGHAYFFELCQQGQDVNPNHDYKREMTSVYNEEFQRNIPSAVRVEKNETLKKQIDAAVKEAKQNYQLWKE